MTTLIRRIADRFIGINRDDLTTAERQVVRLLEDAGYVKFNDNSDLEAVPRVERQPSDDAKGHREKESFQLLQARIADLSASLDEAFNELTDAFPLVDGEWCMMGNNKLSVVFPQDD